MEISWSLLYGILLMMVGSFGLGRLSVGLYAKPMEAWKFTRQSASSVISFALGIGLLLMFALENQLIPREWFLHP